MKFFSFLSSVAKTVFYVLLIFFVLSLISLISKHENPSGNIAVVEILGPIEETTEVIQEIKEFRENKQIKAIILRVDSPGGAVGASQEVYEEVIKTKAEKPVVASFGNLAASGGYYVSASASKIVSNPGTLTGSIGVISSFFMVDNLLKKLHLKWEVIQSGSNKDVGSPLRPMTPEEKKLLQSISDDVYDQFVTAVAEGRSLDKAKVKEFADGRVFSGRKAKELGLVDELGGLEKAIEVAAAEAKMTEKPDVIYPSEDPYEFWSHLAEGKISLPNLFKFEYRFPGFGL